LIGPRISERNGLAKCVGATFLTGVQTSYGGAATRSPIALDQKTTRDRHPFQITFTVRVDEIGATDELWRCVAAEDAIHVFGIRI
jgi:hypothetical protein